MSAGPVIGLAHRLGTGLGPLFAPGSIAVVTGEGPSPVARALVANLRGGGFRGRLHLGVPAGAVDLAIIDVSGDALIEVLRTVLRSGVLVVMVTGRCDAVQAAEAAALADHAGVRLLGPGARGVLVPRLRLNAARCGPLPQAGGVACVCQGGAMLATLAAWARREGVGISAMVAAGSFAEVGLGDLVEHLGDDHATQAIVIACDGIEDPAGFLAAARRVTLRKPVVLLTTAAQETPVHSARTHAGMLLDADAALNAALRRVGVLRVANLGDLCDLGLVLARWTHAPGRRLALVADAAGPARLAAQAVRVGGGEVIGPHLIDEDAEAAEVGAAVAAALVRPDADGVLFIHVGRDGGAGDAAIARAVLAARPAVGRRPLFACWLGDASGGEGRRLLLQAGVPVCAEPDAAGRAFIQLWTYGQHLTALYETPVLLGPAEGQRAPGEAILRQAMADGCDVLDEVSSKALLASWGIPVVPTLIAIDPDQAVGHARLLGYPVVLKALADGLDHKSDAGGVRLELADEAELRAAWLGIIQALAGRFPLRGMTVQPMIRRIGVEALVGAASDPRLGPVLVFGTGGILAEVQRDVAVALPPLTSTLAAELVGRTRLSIALAGVRGRPACDRVALERVLVAVGRLVLAVPRIAALDINPLLISADGAIALDARIELHPARIADGDLPRPVIRPWPVEYVHHATLRDGTPVEVRPIRPEDEPTLVAFHQELSAETVRLRFFGHLPLAARTEHARLIQVCHTDYRRELPLVVESGGRLLAVGRLTRARQRPEAELAAVVSDRWQGRGLGHLLMQRLIAVARAEGLERLVCVMLADNRAMRRLVERHGFSTRNDPEDPGQVQGVLVC